MGNDKVDKVKLKEEDFIRYQLFEKNESTFKKYSNLVIGNSSILKLIKYELITTIFGSIPGAIGLFLRKLFYPTLFRSTGKGIVIGKNSTIRHPNKIILGNRVVVDDYCVIDARGSGDQGVVIGDDVFIGRNVTIQSKVGPITIGNKVSIGAQSILTAQGEIRIGDMVNLAGGCYISGGSYDVARQLNSEREHGKYTKGPIIIGNKCRLGMGVIVLDGARIDNGTIVGAMSLVTSNLPAFSVAAGSPAKVLYERERK